MTDSPFLVVERREAPLILTFPHTGTGLPDEFATRFVSPWLARKNADWHVERLYAFAADLGATFVRTTVSRSVIDPNRDPSGASLYPGQTTTGLCPTETFEGEPLYRLGEEPDAAEIADRRVRFFDPFHAALAAEIARLRAIHPRVVVYDCHSIRSVLPRLFDGELPQFNIGTNSGAACAPAVKDAVATPCAASGLPMVVDGRFKGGWITRANGRPETGVHAVQMELGWRGYLHEPAEVTPGNWPVEFDPAHAEPVRRVLEEALRGLLAFARG
jgi:formiminoglutamase